MNDNQISTNATHKLNRAQYHISELTQRMYEYETSNPIKTKQTETEIIIERERSYTIDMALILGDAIHNLRTALDFLASDLVQLNGKSTKNVYFPFAENATELEKNIIQKKFDRAGDDAVNILRKIAPHKEGDKNLYGLHNLDIMDKHRLILPTTSAFEMHGFNLKGPKGEIVASVIKGPGDGFSISANRDDRATWDSIRFTAVFDFDIGVPEIFRGRPIIETLKELSDIVSQVIKKFEKT